jgi:type I restriction enzyme S subunit
MLTKAGLAEVGGKLLPVGTVLLTKRAPVGCVVMNAIPMVTNQGFLSFTCGPRLRPVYLVHWLRANRPYLDKVANGSTYPELYAGDLFEFEIAVPDLPTQDRIIEVISSLQFLTALGHPLEQSVYSPEALMARQEQTRRLRGLRDSVLPLLLGGELDAAHLKNGFFATT